MFHIMRLLGKGDPAVQDTISDMDTVESFSQCSDLAGNMLTDEDYLNFMSDTLFSTITNHQPFAFPDCREIARGASLADFIQPSLGPLQPNLDDFMDTLEPLQETFAELLSSTPRLPPVPEESALPAEDSLYRGGGMSVDTYSQGYIGAQSTAAVTMPTSQMSIHGTSNNTQMLMSEESIKNEQMRAYDSSRMFAQSDMQNMMGAEMMPQYGYEARPEAQLGNVYGAKARVQHVAAPKIVTQPDSAYYKSYTAAVPPSQTAPETVTLLQQPLQSSKYASTIVIQGRGAYGRDKPRSRHAHYPPAPAPAAPQPAPAPPYQGYSQPMPSQTQSYERVRQQPMQYLPAPDAYKPKPPPVNPRSFKMPSPPLVAATSQQVSAAGSSGSSSSGATSPGGRKDQFRSHSLPLGAQLNADWTLSAPHAHAPAHAHAHEPAHSRHTARPRESPPNSVRMRSRSTSGGAGATAEGARLPPPLNSVASEPSLPQASVMLAQLLSAQHSKSLYKMGSNEEVAGSSDPKSPIRKGQPSPIGSDVMSPHQSLSPPTSPGSPRAGSPREPRRTHLHAEQKRRYNIKNGFDTLQALIPHLNSNPAAKISKAAMLQKGAEYIKQLKAERNQIKEEMESLRQQTESLNNSISNCHSLLPATGAPVSRARAGRLREMFARHVANRTMHNWKYWLFSVVAAALVDSFSACVSCGSGADLVRTTLLWAEQHCSLVEMRPAVLNSLRVLCTTTDILTNPERLPEEARQAAAASAGVKAEPT
ncbi:hypothetical protein ABMA27_013945 [Loxostege sticticalis]|uniref:BHLH domain-containing protein n=1 Tax=Loxostege sticticalis TaxID=481309 RepID=A0ABR3IC23_LOXSC